MCPDRQYITTTSNHPILGRGKDNGSRGSNLEEFLELPASSGEALASLSLGELQAMQEHLHGEYELRFVPRGFLSLKKTLTGHPAGAQRSQPQPNGTDRAGHHTKDADGPRMARIEMIFTDL